MVFRFIDAEKGNFDVAVMCRVLGVSRSGYYAWARRSPSERTLANATLVEEIRRVHTQSDGTYGSRRVHAELRRAGHEVNHKRIERLMRMEGIQGAYVPPKRRRNADCALGVDGVKVWPDLVKRDFQPDAPEPAVVLGHEADPDRRGRAAPRQRCWTASRRRIVGWADGGRSPTRRWSLARSRWPSPSAGPARGSSTTQTAAVRADSIGRRNTRSRRIAMGRPKGWASDVTGRPVMRSPGRAVGGAAGASCAVLGGDRTRGCERGRLRRRRACRRRLASGGSGRVAGCRRSPSPRCRGGTCRSPSGRRSRSCAPMGVVCERSRVGSAARRRRSPASLVATPRLAAALLSIEPAPRSGMPIGGGGVPKPAKLAANPELRRYVQDRLSGDGGAVLTGVAGGRVRRCGGIGSSCDGRPQGPAVGRRRGARSRYRQPAAAGVPR